MSCSISPNKARLSNAQDSLHGPECVVKLTNGRCDVRRHYKLTGATIRVTGPTGRTQHYVLRCEAHGTVALARNVAHANYYIARAWRWCDGCERARAASTEVLR